MADKRIGELTAAPALYDDTLFAVEQQGEARKITGRQIKAAGGGGSGYVGGGFVEMVTSIPVANRVPNTLYGLILESYEDEPEPEPEPTGPLPAGYTLLKYISNPNLTYIANPWGAALPFNNRRIEMSISLDEDSSIAGRHIMGSESFSNIYNNGYTTSDDTSILAFTNNTTLNSPELGLNLGHSSVRQTIGLHCKLSASPNGVTDIVIDLPKKLWIVNGVSAATKEYYGDSDTDTGTGASNSSLFATYLYQKTKGITDSSPTTTTNPCYSACNFRLHSLKIYSSSASGTGELLYDFYPCKNPQGVVGIYDAINEQFFTSTDSSKVFAAGPAV